MVVGEEREYSKDAVGREIFGGIFGDAFENKCVIAIHAFCI
jgi:hypothetical protein